MYHFNILSISSSLSLFEEDSIRSSFSQGFPGRSNYNLYDRLSAMSALGNFIRLHPLHTNELPNHSALNSLINGPKGKQASNGNTPTNGAVTRPDLRQFITHILTEASAFAESIVPSTFSSKGRKVSPPARNTVEILQHFFSERTIQDVPWQNPLLPRQWSGQGIKPAEHWFARRSRHANQSEEGTATFSEFDYGLRHDHPEHEMDYTPDVYDCYEVLTWDDEIEQELEEQGAIKSHTGSYTEVHMSIREMCHKLPWPLQNRVFPVLVITAKGPQKHSFIVTQIPVDISNVTSAFYSNKRNLHDGKSRIKRKSAILG